MFYSHFFRAQLGREPGHQERGNLSIRRAVTRHGPHRLVQFEIVLEYAFAETIGTVFTFSMLIRMTLGLIGILLILRTV